MSKYTWTDELDDRKLAKELGKDTHHVALALAKRMDRTGLTSTRWRRHPWRGVKELADHLGMRPDTVRRCVARLIERGLLHQVRAGGGRHRPALFVATLPCPVTDLAAALPGVEAAAVQPELPLAAAAAGEGEDQEDDVTAADVLLAIATGTGDFSVDAPVELRDVLELATAGCAVQASGVVDGDAGGPGPAAATSERKVTLAGDGGPVAELSTAVPNGAPAGPAMVVSGTASTPLPPNAPPPGTADTPPIGRDRQQPAQPCRARANRQRRSRRATSGLGGPGRQTAPAGKAPGDRPAPPDGMRRFADALRGVTSIDRGRVARSAAMWERIEALHTATGTAYETLGKLVSDAGVGLRLSDAKKLFGALHHRLDIVADALARRQAADARQRELGAAPAPAAPPRPIGLYAGTARAGLEACREALAAQAAASSPARPARRARGAAAPRAIPMPVLLARVEARAGEDAVDGKDRK